MSHFWKFVGGWDDVIGFISSIDKALVRGADKIRHAEVCLDHAREIGIMITDKGMYITLSDRASEVVIAYDGTPLITFHTHPDVSCRPSYSDLVTMIKDPPRVDIIKGTDGYFVSDCTSDDFIEFAATYKALRGRDKVRYIRGFLRVFLCNVPSAATKKEMFTRISAKVKNACTRSYASPT